MGTAFESVRRAATRLHRKTGAEHIVCRTAIVSGQRTYHALPVATALRASETDGAILLWSSHDGHGLASIHFPVRPAINAAEADVA